MSNLCSLRSNVDQFETQTIIFDINQNNLVPDDLIQKCSTRIHKVSPQPDLIDFGALMPTFPSFTPVEWMNCTKKN